MQENEKVELAKIANANNFELQTLKVLPQRSMKGNIIHSKWNAQCNNVIICQFIHPVIKLKMFYFVRVNLTMPALYPGLDKPSRPIEGYPPVGPPPQLPAANIHKRMLMLTNHRAHGTLEN